MATRQQKKGDEGGMVGRLAGRGEEALSRLMDELGSNPRVSDALSKAMSAKGKLDSASRNALGQVGLAASDELKDLRRQIERLEQRLAKLEASSGRAKPTAKKATSKRTPTAKKGTARTKKEAEETRSPAAGRALGGGTARGGKPGGGTS